jgi:hypothetical protein
MSATLTGRAVRALVRNGQLEVENELLRTVIADAVLEIKSGRAQHAADILVEAVNGLDAA